MEGEFLPMVDNLLGFHCSLLLIFVCACTHVGVCICVCAPVSACVQRSGIHVGHCLSGSVLLVSFFFFLFFPCMLEFNPLRQVNQMHEALLFFFFNQEQYMLVCFAFETVSLTGF